MLKYTNINHENDSGQDDLVECIYFVLETNGTCLHTATRNTFHIRTFGMFLELASDASNSTRQLI